MESVQQFFYLLKYLAAHTVYFLGFILEYCVLWKTIRELPFSLLQWASNFGGEGLVFIYLSVACLSSSPWAEVAFKQVITSCSVSEEGWEMTQDVWNNLLCVTTEQDVSDSFALLVKERLPPQHDS